MAADAGLQLIVLNIETDGSRAAQHERQGIQSSPSGWSARIGDAAGP